MKVFLGFTAGLFGGTLLGFSLLAITAFKSPEIREQIEVNSKYFGQI